MCSVAFRVHGHLAKHLRSRVHVTRLENIGAVPAGTFDVLEHFPGAIRAVVPTDPDSALHSILALLAKKLKVDQVHGRYRLVKMLICIKNCEFKVPFGFKLHHFALTVYIMSVNAGKQSVVYICKYLVCSKMIWSCM